MRLNLFVGGVETAGACGWVQESRQVGENLGKPRSRGLQYFPACMSWWESRDQKLVGVE
jgi:hypothetical protein